MPDKSGTSLTFTSVRLCRLPTALKVAVTACLLLLTVGLIAAVWHMYDAYASADGRPNLTMVDFRVVLGGERPLREPVTHEDTALWSQIHGEMRGFLKSRTELEILEAWLAAGAMEGTYEWPWTIGPGGPYPAPGTVAAPGRVPASQPSFQRSPSEVIRDNCVGCHNPGGEQPRSPLHGYAQVARYTSLPERPVARVPERSEQIAVLHAHLLTIPMFVLVLAALFYLADWPPGSAAGRGVITALPIACVAADVVFTMLSGMAGILIYATLAVRGAFLLTIAVQILGVFGGLWQKPELTQTTRAEP